VNALQALATQLREEETPVTPHVVDPPEQPDLGKYAPAIEAIREGYLLHYGEARLLAGHDPDLGLLAGDYLYALGLAHLARLGDVKAVSVLADLISRSAQLHTEGREPEVPALWEAAIDEVAG
jgi:hypothetical protein